MMRSDLVLPKDRVALLLIDLQEEHRRDRRYLVDGYADILANSAKLLAAARSAELPVLHAAYERDFSLVPARPYEPTNANGTPWFSPPGDAMTAICPEVAPLEHEAVLHKNDSSCFSDRRFSDMLAGACDGAPPEWLIVAGVWTEACVGETVRHAVEKGYRVLLVKDACGSGTAAMHQTALLHLANRLYGGAVATTAVTVTLIAGARRKVWQLVGSTPLRFHADTIAQQFESL